MISALISCNIHKTTFVTMSAATTIVTLDFYERNIKPNVGHIWNQKEYYDCAVHVIFDKVKKRFANIPKGKKVVAVIAETQLNSNFKNVRNKAMPLDCPMFVSENLDGAYDITGDYFTNFVIGNVYIVVNF